MHQFVTHGRTWCTLWTTWALRGCKPHWPGRPTGCQPPSPPVAVPSDLNTTVCLPLRNVECVWVAMLTWRSGERAAEISRSSQSILGGFFSAWWFWCFRLQCSPNESNVCKTDELVRRRTSAWGQRFLHLSLLPAKNCHWAKPSMIVFGTSSLWTVSIFLPCTQWPGHSLKTWFLKWITGQTFPFLQLW